jgi:hypothetical protein
MANSGEWDGAQYQYVVTPLITKRTSGVPSTWCSFYDTKIEHQGDDAITMHYSHDFIVDGVRALYARDNGITTMGVECDDGSYNGSVKNVYARGIAFGVAAKAHTSPDHPAPSNINFDGITLERGYGRVLWISGNVGGDPTFGTNINATNIFYNRPVSVASSENIGIHITNGATNVTVRNFTLRARAGDALYRALYVSGGAKNVLVDGGQIENWAPPDDAGATANGDTMRISSNGEDVKFANIKAFGCGKFGLWDSGALRSDFQNISLQGTSVASSIGFWVSVSTATTATTNRAVKIIGGFTTPTTIVP